MFPKNGQNRIDDGLRRLRNRTFADLLPHDLTGGAANYDKLTGFELRSI